MYATMPKQNSARISEAQRQRQVISKKFEKYAPSTVYLQVLGSGARGAPNSLYLFTDQKRYMFNCGECTQRLAHEHKVRLSRLDHIFITNKTWKNIGGLPGLSLTLQDVGVPNITLHGPEGLDELYNATRRFVIMKDMNVTMAKCSPSEDFEDNVMTVKYIIMSSTDESILQTELKPLKKKPKLDETIQEKEYEEFIHDDTDYYKRDNDQGDKTKNNNTYAKPKTKHPFDKDAYKKKEEKVLYDLQRNTHSCVAYICTLKKRLGTLDLEKCVQFGVKPGPLLGQLKSGQDVVLPDGTLVHSKDVKTPDDPGPVFIVLEVPDLSYLQESDFALHFDNGTNPAENVPTLIVHYTPPHVLHHPKYSEFMSKFGPKTRHLVLNSQNTCLGSEAVHRTQHKLHLLDADVFPLLRDVSVPATWAPSVATTPTSTPTPARLKGLDELKNKIAVAQFQNIISMEGSAGDGDLHAVDCNKLDLIAGRTLTMFHLRPKRQLDRSAEPKLHIQDYIKETMDVDGFVGSLEHFRRVVDSMRYTKNDLQKEYPKVVFLGTGSCIPSKTRNTSAIVVQIDEHHSMLLDCGEGTFGQLVRFYGPKRVNGFLRTLKAVYVSHLHADHHLGLFGVLQARREAIEETECSEPLYLLAPGQIVTWLSMYDHQFESIRSDFTLIPNQNLLEAKINDPSNTDMTSAVLSSIGIQHVDTCLVSHCPNAFGVAIQVDEQHKITYSGDTIPCEELVRIGRNSTLLIHEATMEDELADEARLKMHSTTTQAINIGQQMNAKYTVLTHFSQRYARLPRLNSHILHDNNSVGIAFDNMQITMSDLDLLPHMYAPLQLMFADHCVDLEMKAANRARQKEKRPSSPPIDTSVSENQPRRIPSNSLPPSNHSESSVPNQKQVCKINAKRFCQNKSHSPPKIANSKLPNQSNTGSKASSPERINTTVSNTNEALNIENTNGDCVTNNVNVPPVAAGPNTLTTKKETKRYISPKIIKKNTTPNSSPSRTASDALPDVPVGYGKAMVTPVKKQLVLRKDNKTPPANEKSPMRFGRMPSPQCSLKDSKQPPSPTPNKRENTSNSRLPTRETSRTYERARGLSGTDAQSVHVTNTRGIRPSNQSTTPNRTAMSPRRQSLERNTNDTRNTSPNKGGTCQTSYAHSTRASTLGNPPVTRNVRNRLPVTRRGSCTKENIRSAQGLNRSNRSFQPELEDIKSSYLLLRDKTGDKRLRNKVDDGVVESKPAPLNEFQRQANLKECMRKFRTKQFWHDSKYEKIEGLNWITWK
ncbi:ribonuclease Z, mitochondrial isoform X5 [Danaus plexippus]|uniref:ribonuclease Z, mitochondrial isoform X5 n=1 Tax=Danaus plexippus TaxID=13037 RepID=UPI002AB2CFC7|nr:ribonuclease Z, mitochondrial isoform X5 [Danaus plexippus]